MARYFGDLVDLDLRPYMPDVSAPTLIMSGNQDPYVSVGSTEALSTTLRDSEMVLIDRSGHLPMFENWPEYQKAITSFMDRLMSGTDANKTLF
jgi:pimeloyl-ACP methyl ester carboxylesterase